MRYEVAVSVQNGDIVWIHGGFPCGTMPDISIFRSALISELDDDELVIADNGYRGEPGKVLTPVALTLCGNIELKDLASVLRARHETCNRRFKTWGCLAQTFRHPLQYHKDCFFAVAVIEQLRIDHGETLFEPDPQWML